MEVNTRFHYSVLNRILSVVAVLALLLGGLAAPVKVARAAPSNILLLSVISANDSDAYGITKGDPITNFKYIINIDNTGTTEQRSPADGCAPGAGYPESCNWVSVAGRANNSPIFTQGDQSDFGSGINLPDGRYLVSVLADGYKIDGAHFTVPIPNNGNVTVEMQPYDLPDATIQASVFEDMAPTNSAPDVPAERGLAGFKAHITDYIDEVTTDVYGNPICGNGQCLSKCYVVADGLDIGTVDPVDADGRCPIDFTAGPGGDPLLGADITATNEGDPIPVGAVIEGKVIIPNLGPNRYALSVVAPNQSGWIQTTTLEGNHDWDAWVMEGATGLDTEFTVAGEPFPATFFGYVKPMNSMGSGSGTISGTALAVSAYIPPTGGITGELGLLGAKPKEKNPIQRLFVSLSDINNGDQTVFVGEFDCNAACDPVNFSIPGVPDGDYFIGIWDEPQDYIFNEQNVSVRNGEVVDMGSISMMGWWTTIEGHVFNDLNENGKMDADEPGIAGFPIVMRTRENSIMDRGATAVTTDANGYYWMENAYPMTQWLIEEAYADGFKTTGITYQADNQPEETTVLGQGVDVNVHPVIGLGGRLDWGVKAYATGENGGIVGTISYDTTRNELNPQYAAIEDWQPSIAGLTVDLYQPVACEYDLNGDPIPPCDPLGLYKLNPDGSYMLGQLLNQYTSETWERPSGCVARNVNGDPLQDGVDENVLPDNSVGNDKPCLEAPMMGMQFGPMASDVGTPAENFGASVDGNYGFGDGCFGEGGYVPGTGTCSTGDFTALPSNMDFLVKVEIPDDALGRPMYKVTKEEDINVAAGDSFIPQVPPPECAGALHTVDLAGAGADNYAAVVGAGYDINGLPVGVTVDTSTPVDNAPFLDMGGTVYEGQPKPLCDMKLVHLSDRKSIAPGFNLFTDVPLPSRFWGLIVDDLNFSSNPQSLSYGEKMGVPFAPVGIYDYTNRLIYTVESDYNGLYDVLLPSTNRISCPTPSGVCANLYRLVGNDPGVPGHWNPNYTPQYRTISAEFETFPGLTIPADLAPTQVAVAVQIPGQQTLAPISCTLPDEQPQLLAVSKPYANLSGGPVSFTIDGFGFGATQGIGQVLLDNSSLPVNSWNDGHIDVTVPSATTNGVHQLSIKASNGMRTVNGLTFHVFGSATVSPSPFPANATPLDGFTNRPSGTLNSNWSSNGGGFFVVNNSGTGNDYLRVRTGGVIHNAWWTTASFGTSQEAYITFRRPSGIPGANEQGLLLKYNGLGTNPNGSAARWIEVALDNNNSNDPEAMTVRVRTKSGTGPLANQFTELLNLATPEAVFSSADKLGARAMSNGDIIIYKNGSEIGRVGSGTGTWTGYIGLRFEGTGNSAATEARVDNFGGGNVTLVTNTGSAPSLFEVGPGYPYDTIQSALDAAAAQTPNKNSLVVVYPGAVDNNNPRYNGRGAYYENLIMYAPVKLQGVGPGGVRPDHSVVNGSIIDGIAFGGDTALATNWLGKISTLTWDGNQDINDGQVIYVLASDTGSSTLNRAGSFSSTSYKASIDGFDIRGGDQQGLPGNLNAIFGGFPGPIQALQIQTQGGAIFANSFARNLQITNNVIEGNGGSYGAIRIGTPNIGDQQNDNMRIANNRILANGGTNLAGAIGLFNGAQNYEVAGNDICGNFSAEYGGGISHFGLSSGGKIHDNRIYFNRSYDEGAGIMIAGELPLDASANYGTTNGAKGSGAVDIYNNLIQANLGDDDGGGLRFLMSASDCNSGSSGLQPCPINVYNNMIVNNVSTHEGGGVALDDAPNVRFYNNTVMKNLTTATAITSNGLPAPAGLSTGGNSTQLQAVLLGGIAGCGVGTNAKCYSDPLLFNNIFYDNRAGQKGVNTVTGISAGDANIWDLGSLDLSINLAPTNSIVQQTAYPYTSGAGDLASDPTVIQTHDIPLTFTSWRTNVNFVGAIMVTADLDPTQMGDYHLFDNTSPAYNAGAANKSVPLYQQLPALLAAPAFDIDNEGRPGFSLFDMGADEIPAPTADLSITKSDGATEVDQGSQVHYSITVANAGPDAANNAVVTDTAPAALTGVTWTCVANPGGNCDAASGSGNSISTTVDLLSGGSVLITVNGTLSATATGTLNNTASVATPAGVTDPVSGNNSASDSDNIAVTMHVGDLDATTSNTSNTNWQASVAVTIHDASHNPLAGGSIFSGQAILVTGTWSAGTGGSSFCLITNASGQCTVTRSLSKTTDPSATFTVTSVTKLGYTYRSSANHDPDGDSTGTAITASRLTMSVTSLTSTASGTTSWSTTVTITVKDSNGNAVSGASVSGTWAGVGGSGGTGSGGTSCTTNASGVCTVTRTGIASTRTSVNFAVTGVTKSSGSPAVSYVAGPTTNITVNRPY